jgi:hypothetical protein
MAEEIIPKKKITTSLDVNSLFTKREAKFFMLFMVIVI